jgi:hypothetical protein
MTAAVATLPLVAAGDASPASLEALPFPAPVLGFLLVHAGLRRECQAMVDGARRGEDVRRRLALFDRVIRAHHHGEDRVLLPMLSSREPAIQEAAEEAEAQHVELDLTLDRLRRTTGAADLQAGVGRLAALVEDHLILEETRLLPTWLAVLSPAEHQRFTRRLRRATPWRDVAVMVPWLLDAVPPAFRPAAETELPAHVRFAYRHAMRRRFERCWRPQATSQA